MSWVTDDFKTWAEAHACNSLRGPIYDPQTNSFVVLLTQLCLQGHVTTVHSIRLCEVAYYLKIDNH